MRLALLSCLLLVACDLQPPKKRDRTAATADAAASATPDAGPAMSRDEACTAVGVHIAQLLIDTETEATQKAVLEQDRTKLVRSTADNCRRAGWSDAARSCFLAAKTRAALEACGRTLAR